LRNTKGQTEAQSPDRVADGIDEGAEQSASSECCGVRKHEETDERSWMERIVDPSNLNRAWKRVRSNRGGPGIDGITIETFPALFAQHGDRIRSALLNGTYQPAAVRRSFIAKPDGTQRPLGIPTVMDRWIQQAITQVIGPLFESGFSEHSHGYRPGHSAAQAVNTMVEGWKDGCRYAVDCDLKAFFDTVNHDRLMAQLREKLPDPLVLQLIHRYLTAGVVLLDGSREETSEGVPQGGPLSPLLANIVLDPLDQELSRRGHRFARYADDFLIMVSSARAANRVMHSVINFVEHRLKLTVNRTKSRAGLLRDSAFLGFTISRSGKLVWTPKALERFRLRIKDGAERRWSAEGDPKGGEAIKSPPAVGG
jgi:RNA-directed DNA polymerase